MASEDKINLMGELYDEYLLIANNITIKYSVTAEKYETLESKQSADEYLDVINGKDDFFTYIDYTTTDYYTVGWDDYETIQKVIDTGDTTLVPEKYRDQLLEIRRQRVLDEFEEQNNYYRMLNGYPDLDDDDYYYPSSKLVEKYDFPEDVPIHEIQDWGNEEESGYGDYLISIAEGTGYIDELIAAHSDKEYLTHIGSKRISINKARNALNFQLLLLEKGVVRQSVYDEFILRYEECREYFVKTVYITDYRSFFDKYDNLIAMCIFVMTTQQMNMRQLMSGVKRSFYSIYGVRALYKAYHVPYDLDIDEDTQNAILQNLNLMINNKATNKVLYNIAEILGFANLKIYKYYLGKERRFDNYGVPIVKYTEKFNINTGEMEIIPDYEAMYKLYFQKEELSSHNLAKSFLQNANTASYEEITSADPFWWEDQNLYDRVWQTEYNFVESKYLGIGVAYSMTNILFENVILIKMLLTKRDDIYSISVYLPKLVEGLRIPLYDTIILLICLTAAKHNLTGEIITIPTQVINVVDYMQNVEDTSKLVDTLSFNFDFFDPSNTEAQKMMMDLKAELGDAKYAEFQSYIDSVRIISSYSSEQKIKAINELYTDAVSLHRFLVYNMTATSSRKTYDLLKTMNDTIFYCKELRSVFTITGEITGTERTAWNYYEYLYHINPILYKSVFEVDLNQQWLDYCKEHGKTKEEFPYEDYLIQIEYGNIKANYGTVKTVSETARDDVIYEDINHIIDRLQQTIGGLNYMYLMNDSSTPLSNLLEKLIIFFKSYTVDLINFDILFYMDMKPENTIRLFDEIAEYFKEFKVKDNLYLSYGDIVHYFQTKLFAQERLSLRDKLFYLTLLTIDKEYGPLNSIKLDDLIYRMIKIIEIREFDIAFMFDRVELITAGYNLFDKKILNDQWQYKVKQILDIDTFPDQLINFHTDCDIAGKEIEIYSRDLSAIFDRALIESSETTKDESLTVLRDKVTVKYDE